MAQQTVNIGSAPNDGTGDTLRVAGDKINDNFTELYAGLTGLLDFKGSTDCSANPNYPAASKGDYYLVSVAGKIGGASGIDVEAGDSFFALADNAGGNQATVGASWTVVQGNVVIDIDGTLAANSDAKVPSQKAVKTYVDGAVAVAGGPVEVLDEGATETAALVSLNFTGAGVTASDDGSGNVDVTISGSSFVSAWKEPVRCATTSAKTLATDMENGDTIDGVVIATGDRVLVKNQAAPAENGIYTVNASGTPTRADDANGGAELVGAMVPVSEGTVNADKVFQCTTNAPITLGTTGLTFAAFMPGWVLAGTGQTATGIWDFAVDGAKTNVDFVGLGSYNELLIIIDAVTASGAGGRTVRASTDNGSTFYSTSGDYVLLSSTGAVTNSGSASFLSGGTAAASTVHVHIRNLKGAIKSFTSSGSSSNALFRASASDINAVRITTTTADTMNGGKIYIYGR